MKTCRKCGATKPLSEFYRHPTMRDGYTHKCSVCLRAIALETRRKNLARYVAYDRGRLATVEGRMDKANRDRRHMENHPVRRAAYAAVRAARHRNALPKKPCEVCGSNSVQAHHHDYTKPLDVRWLCETHHLAEHGKQLHQL